MCVVYFQTTSIMSSQRRRENVLIKPLRQARPVCVCMCVFENLCGSEVGEEKKVSSPLLLYYQNIFFKSTRLERPQIKMGAR